MTGCALLACLFSPSSCRSRRPTHWAMELSWAPLRPRSPLHTARHSDGIAVVLAALLAACVVAAIHVALGLVFDPRYKDFPFALLTGPVLALCILAFAGSKASPRPGFAELVAAIVLTGSALFIIANEGTANWQALLFGALLVLLALTVLTTRAAPG